MTIKKISKLIICLAVTNIGFTHAETIKPVVVNDDQSVTITVSLPKAQQVWLKGSFIKGRTFTTPAGTFSKEGKWKMTKRDDSTWTYRTTPLRSDMYTYNFEMEVGDDEEVDTFDIDNPDKVRDVNTWLNYFIIPGGVGDDFITQNVPHGKMSFVWYDSSIPAVPRRRMTVYTPPSYDSSKKYPVLYLLHGSGGDETSWTTLGRAAQILDNMIAQGSCVPMIVVMPNVIANRAAAPGADPYNNNPATANALESMTGTIEKTFMNDVVKYIEHHYPVLTKKDDRAIAGLSLGGLHTIFITANNPKKFGYVGLFSAQTTNKMGSEDRRKNLKFLAKGAKYLKSIFSGLGKGKVGTMVESISGGSIDIYGDVDKKLARQFFNPPKLYYIACGKDDFVKKLNDDFRAKLDADDYKYVYNESEGGHSWDNWRKYLVDFLPRLFK